LDNPKGKYHLEDLGVNGGKYLNRCKLNMEYILLIPEASGSIK
jgi:hypothetical protein